jgi:hypothetical protein
MKPSQVKLPAPYSTVAPICSSLPPLKTVAASLSPWLPAPPSPAGSEPEQRQRPAAVVPSHDRGRAARRCFSSKAHSLSAPIATATAVAANATPSPEGKS